MTRSTAPAAAPRRLRSILRGGARIALGLLVLLASAEVGLRLFGWWVLTTRHAAVERALENTPNAVRLLHVGESTTFGQDVEPSQAYPAVVARLLEARYPGRHFVSFNRGVPGVTTSSIRRTFRSKLAEIQPQLVTILAGVNDFNEQLNGLDDFGERGALAPVSAYLSDLRLFKVARLALDLRHPGVSSKHGDITVYQAGNTKYLIDATPRDDAKIAHVTARMEADLHALLSWCRDAGVQAVLVGYIQCDYEDAVIEKVARDAGVPYVSTFVPRDARRPELFTADGWHPAALGHKMMAERIAAVIGPLLDQFPPP